MERLWGKFLIALDFLRYCLATCLLYGLGLILIMVVLGAALTLVAPEVVQIINGPTP